MNFPNAGEPTIQSSSLRDEVANLVHWAEEAIRREGVDQEISSRLLASLLSSAADGEDERSVHVTIQRIVKQTEKLEAVFRELLARFETWQVSQTQPAVNIEYEWGRKSVEIEHSFKRNPKEGAAKWLQTYAEALLRWDLDLCNKLIEEDFPFTLEDAAIPVLFRKGTQALQTGDYRSALEMLEYLVSISSARTSPSPLDSTTQARVIVQIGRIHLFQENNTSEALQRFDQAKKLAAEDACVSAALGDYYRAAAEWRDARLQYQRSVYSSVDEPFGYLGMALLSDSQKLWDEALSWYKQAVQITFSKFSSEDDINLRREVTPEEYSDPEISARVLDYLMRTVRLETKDASVDRMDIYGRLLAIISEAAGKAEEAAEAFYQSGQIFMQLNEVQAALDLFARANSLNEKYVPTYWSLADAWRILSPRDIEGLKKSQEFWERGLAIEPPDIPYSWAYVTRALINQQRTQIPDGEKEILSWEGITYLERAILLDDMETYRWAYLSDFYSNLYLRYCALHASEKAIKGNPSDPVAIEKSAVALLDTGYLGKADEAVNKVLESNPKSVLSRYLRAHINYSQGEYQATLDLLNDIFIDVPLPHSVALLPLHALSNEMLFQEDQALHDYELIWEHRGDVGNEPFIAWAAYQLGRVDEAFDILENLLHNAHQAGSAHRNLGFLYLYRGDLERGEQELNHGIDVAIHAQELDELLNVGFPLLERSQKRLLSTHEWDQVLRRIKEKIKRRREELDTPFPSPYELAEAAEQELLQMMQSCTQGDPSWVGVHAGLARLYLENAKLDMSASEYLLLSQQDPQNAAQRFLEASVGLSKVATEYARLAWQASQRGDFSETKEKFRRGLILRERAGISISAEDLISDLMSKSAYLPDGDQYELLQKAKLELDKGSIP
jgi:tetratricopeptide (TPR) repeat protein